MRRPAPLVALLFLLCAGGALAYNETIHALLAQRAFAADQPFTAEVLQPPTAQDLAALRALFWKTAAQSPQGAAFLAQFPTAESFDAWSFKRFVMLDPAATVHGFDLTRDDTAPIPRGRLLELASRWPDDDERNRHRYLRDAKTHEAEKGPDGQPLPEDPATLDFGSLTGTTSQGHAHYGLVEGPLSDDPEVLKKDPARFAVPPTAHAWGAELAQIYTDLALLAATSALPSAPWLTATFAGAAFHHLQDVANQIHTVQVGIYQFFESAFLQSKVRDLKTLGGLLGARRSLKQIGLRLIANHHLLSEDLFAKRVAEAERGILGPPEIRAAYSQLDQDDAAFAKAAAQAIDAAHGAVGFGLSRALIADSSQEAPEVYRLTWQFSAPTLHDAAGHEYDNVNGDDPDTYLAHTPQAEAAQRRFYELEGRGLRRAATALRVWQRRFSQDQAQPDVQQAAVARTLAVLLPYQSAAADRRAAYAPPTPEREGIAWGYPLAAALIAGGICALIWSRLSKRW